MEEAVLESAKGWNATSWFNIDNDLRQAQIRVRAGRTPCAKPASLPQSALAAEQKKLENGKSATYTVLLKQRDLTTARGNEIQALATYNKNLSQLSLDEASTFDRLNINLQVK